MADYTGDWEYWLDSEGKYNYLSPSCEKITGYGQDCFYDDPGFINQIVHPEDYEKVKCHYVGQSEKSRDNHEMEFRLINKNGEVVWIEHKCIPIIGENGEFMGRRGNNRDISKRKVAIKNLEKSEREFRLMVESSVHGFAYHKIITDDEGNPIDYEYILINKVFEEMTGISKNKALGKKVTEFIPNVKDDTINWINIYGKVALTGKETKLESFSETLNKWFSIKAYSPTKGYFATIFEDITDRKNSELEMEDSKNKLEDLVKERTGELEAKVSELDEAVKVFVGREIVIVRLKEEVEELKAKIDTI
jgi:PAS domain S-box-containing protein